MARELLFLLWHLLNAVVLRRDADWVEAANREDAHRLEELSSPEIEIVGPRGTVRGAAILQEWRGRAGLTLETRRGFARGKTV